MGFFDKIKQGLKKTSDAVNHSLDSVFAAFVKVDDDLLEELEEALILSDVGASTAAKIVAEVEKRAKLRKTTTADELRDLLREVLTDNMLDNQPLNTDGKPAVILVIGVNGVGKTTSIGKLAARYVNEGKKVMLSAADTFRAAAAEQLTVILFRDSWQIFCRIFQKRINCVYIRFRAAEVLRFFQQRYQQNHHRFYAVLRQSTCRQHCKRL